MSLGRTTRKPASAVDPLVRALDTEAQPPPGRRAEPVRGGLRRALYRVLRPYTAHRREVDAELIRTLRTLEDRISGLERALATREQPRHTED